MTAAAMPVLFNLCLVGGALVIPVATGWLAVERAMPLAAALILAGLLQLGVMAVMLSRAGRMPRWRLPRFGAAIRRMWKKFTVASAGAVIMQANLVVDLVLASLLPVGAISWLYFADRLAQLPLGVIGIALGTALLPRLSAAGAASGTPRGNRLPMLSSWRLFWFFQRRRLLSSSRLRSSPDCSSTAPSPALLSQQAQRPLLPMPSACRRM